MSWVIQGLPGVEICESTAVTSKRLTVFEPVTYPHSFIIIICVQCNANVAPPSCGRRQIKLQQLVTHGYTTNPGEFPWHAGIFMTTGFQKSYICGGSLVNELSVITAAHCVTDPVNGLVTSPATLFVQLGKFKLNLYGDTVQEHAVQQVIVCEDFQTKTSKYDLAIVRLATQARFTDYVQPICVFPQPPGINYNDGSIRGTVVGWGYTQFDALSDALQGTTLPVVGHTKCLESNPELFERTLYDGMFCAGFKNANQTHIWDLGSVRPPEQAPEYPPKTHFCYILLDIALD
ncbi:serine protease 27 [Culex quinquefasciatus]|uniref:Serine protease 27 n=1 Tax=Culex quinquefasciatus TaxID=7176 RepID=B0W081_CULQU|nr:serine protease 27 [Culex quinquefasciatus]|eukprot:XP_001842115.1 serine protease 27 [Culex quinquefasciatus]